MRNLEPGFRVVGKNGQEIGEIGRCTDTYCEVTTGLLGLGHPLYVPIEAVSSSAGNTVFLDVSAEEIPRLGWDHPPACPPGAQYYGTMPSAPAGRRAEGETEPLLPFLQAGWSVRCADGDEVGRVAEVLPEAFLLEQGPFFHRQRRRVPARAVSRVAENQVFLNLACSDIQNLPTSCGEPGCYNPEPAASKRSASDLRNRHSGPSSAAPRV